LTRSDPVEDPSAKLEALGLQTPGAWLSSLGAGPTTPGGRITGCSHLALGLPSLGRLGCLPVCWADQAHM